MNKQLPATRLSRFIGCACVLLASSNEAYGATNWQDTIKYYLNASSGPTNYSNFSNSTLPRLTGQGQLSGSQILIQSNLTTRENQLSTLIDTNAAAGHISNQTAADLRAQISQITQMQQSYVTSQGGLTNNQTQQLVDALTNVTLQLNSATSDGREYGLEGNYRLGYNQALMQGNLNTRQAQLRAQINAARNSRNLSDQEASTLTSRVDQVANEQANFIRVQNGLTDQQNQQLANELANITTQLNNSLSGNNGYQWNRNGNYRNNNRYSRLASNQALVQGNLTARAGQLSTQINANVSSSHLTQRIASTLRAKLNQISNKQRNYVNRQGGLTDLQYNQLIDELSEVRYTLNASITNVRNAGNSQNINYNNLMAQQSDLQRQIEQAQANGRISIAQADNYERELQNIITQAGRWQNSRDQWRLTSFSQRLSNLAFSLNQNTVSIAGYDYWNR